MTGYMIVLGNCVNCGRFLSFNPDKVPSIRVAGKREPICPRCFGSWNEIHRTSKGLDPLPLHPDAYGPAEV